MPETKFSRRLYFSPLATALAFLIGIVALLHELDGRLSYLLRRVRKYS